MKKFILLILLAITCSSAYSQSIDSHQTVKSLQIGGRYEIVQSEIQRRLTFKVDKYKGIIYQLVKTNSGSYSWEIIPRDIKGKTPLDTNKINYQLFLGGIAARDCFLLNLNTGETWQLVQDKDDNLSFEAFY